MKNYKELILGNIHLIKKIVYKKYYNSIKEDKEDLAQDIIVKLLTQENTYDPSRAKSIKGYIVRACYTCLYDKIKHNKRMHVSDQTKELDNLDPCRILESKEIIDKYLTRLKGKELILLQYINKQEHFNAKEIAEIAGCSVSRIYQIRNNVRNKIRDE